MSRLAMAPSAVAQPSGNPPRIGVVLCTSRKPRANPQIASFVVDTIKATSAKRSGRLDPALNFIDLQERDLPFFNESDVPSQITDYTKYDHAHTRAWSQEVQSYDAFIFVTPQYNWGYPAVLKNAIDYLYNEWKGKPAMIVSYGGHGGGKCNAQLRQVLCGVHMIPTKRSVELSFPGRDFMVKAARGKPLELDGASGSGVWGGAERKNISEAYLELTDLLYTNKVGKMWKSAQLNIGFAKQEIRKKMGRSQPVDSPRRDGNAER